jgi:predicted secreted hydrolase
VWDVQDIWMAHLALSDIQGGRFLHAQRLNRTGPGIASADEKQARVWNGNWSADWNLADGKQTLRAIDDAFSFELTLESAKLPVIHGNRGVSQKAEGAGKASHYISLTRLVTKGAIALEGQRFVVTGSTWMDHEFFSHQLEPGQTGWDWFSLQFDDQTELMLFRLRRTSGALDPFSAGTYIDASGNSRHLAARDFQLTPGNTWKSPASGGQYPVAWTIEVPSLGIKASITTPLSQQEITGGAGTYWEGAVDVEASRQGRPIKGVGYLEMTGYAGRVVGLD